MANEYQRKDHSQHHAAVPDPTPGAGTPGKRTRTEGLRQPTSIAGLAEQVAAYLQQKSSGSPLPGELQGKFGASLGADTSRVRVHTDDGAAQASRGVGARAFTVGSDIFFGRGEYDPGSARGQALIAHEVAHTAQQARAGQAGAQFKLEISAPGGAAEVEADRAAEAMVLGHPAHVSPALGAIYRTPAAVENPEDPNIPGYTPYDEIEEKGNKVYWNDRVDESDGSSTSGERLGGVNVYSEEARSQGLIPNPEDPYGMSDSDVADYDWSGTEVAGAEIPGAWQVSVGAPKQPLPLISKEKDRVTGEDREVTLEVTPVQCAIAQKAVNAFQGCHDAAKGAWTAMSPNIEAFQEAGKNANFKEGGLNWIESEAEGKKLGGKNLEELAEVQKVGHKSEGNATHTVKDIEGLSPEQADKLKSDLPEDKKAKLQVLAGDASSAKKAVGTAYENEKLAIGAHSGAVKALATARTAVDLEKVGDQKDKEETNVKILTNKKAELEKAVDDVLKYYGWAVKTFDGTVEGAMTPLLEPSKEIGMALYRQILTADYDKKISSAAGRASALAAEMARLSSKINAEHAQQAADAVVVAAGQMTTAKATIFEKLTAAEAAQRLFADQAGKQVGGKKGDLVRAAIEALPKVALVVRYCESVVGGATVPSFSAEIGRGMLAAARTPGKFVRHCCEIAGYRSAYQAKLNRWLPLQERLRTIAQSYGLGD